MSLFITFEGPDGSGKSTMANLIYDELVKRGKPVIKTREPGGTRIGEKIRDVILDNDLTEMNMRTEALLYAASRAQHVEEKIKPNIEKGIIVLCERFVLSSLAYQGCARGQNLDDIIAINDFATKGFEPDIIFVFKTDKATLNRKNEESYDRLEMESNDFHDKVTNFYNKLEKKDNYYFIDATQTIGEVFKTCMKILDTEGGLN